MEAAESGLERILTCVDNLKFLLTNSKEEVLRPEEETLLQEADSFRVKFEEAMDDDINTADAIAAVFELVKFANTKADGECSKALLEGLLQKICLMTDILGLIVEKKEEILDEEIEEMIEARQAARKEKNFAKADEIRAQRLEKGILLEDTREGVKWKRV